MNFHKKLLLLHKYSDSIYMAVALIIIYNHRYDRNVEIVEGIYRPRFSHIFHLMPFYDGDKENVIPVYDNSIYFQGYVAQGFRHFFHKDYAHYFFIADDMILNPVINEKNYTEWFALEEDTCFITSLNDVPASKYWSHYRSAVHFNPFYNKAFNTRGVEISGILPAKEEALKKMEAWGIKNTPVLFKNVYGNFFEKWKYKMKLLMEDIFVQHVFYPKKVNYPVTYSYADLFIISQSSIARFSQYCGIFSATHLFVELAIPTAIALSAEKISVEKSIRLQGKALWTSDDLQIISDTYRKDLSLLLKDFPATYIYLHPIKLSQWNTENL